MKFSTTFIAAIMLFVVIHVTSQNTQIDSLNQYFDTLEKNDKVWGAVLISKNGQAIYSRNIGWSDKENNIKNNDKSLYRVGSITKMFTAVMMFKAIEQNKISIDQTIDKYFPNLITAKKIKIKHLLNHRSGLFNFTSFPNYKLYFNKKISRSDLLDSILLLGVEVQPNTKSSYSNTNYVLLSMILQNIYSKPYKELIEDSIIYPLGLKNTYIGTEDIERYENEANSYFKDSTWEEHPKTNLFIPLGAGALISNTEDLKTFIEALMSYKLVSKNSLDTMKIIIDGYGSGLLKFKYDSLYGYGHTGGIDAFSAIVISFPETKTTVSYTFNALNYDNNKILSTLLDYASNKSITIPNFHSETALIEEREAFEGTYISKEQGMEVVISNSPYFMIAKLSNQSAISLEKKNKNTYIDKTSGVEIIFNTIQKNIILIKNGNEILLRKKE